MLYPKSNFSLFHQRRRVEGSRRIAFFLPDRHISRPILLINAISKNVWRFSQSNVPKHRDQLYTSVAGRRSFGHSTPSTALPIPLTDAHVKPKMADLDLKGAPWTDAEDVQLSALQVRTLPPHNRAIAKRFLTSVAFLQPSLRAGQARQPLGRRRRRDARPHRPAVRTKVASQG